MPDLPKISVIVPVYNEFKTLETIVTKLHEVPLPMEIICVNDASNDGSAEVMDRLKAQGRIQQALHHPVNRGKGSASCTTITSPVAAWMPVRSAAPLPRFTGWCSACSMRPWALSRSITAALPSLEASLTQMISIGNGTSCSLAMIVSRVLNSL